MEDYQYISEIAKMANLHLQSFSLSHVFNKIRISAFTEKLQYSQISE
jgi:hypothetical protein